MILIFGIETPLDVELSSMNRQDLMIPGCWQWDVEELSSTRDYAVILSIPLCYGTISDKCIWHFSKDGWFIVCSTYCLVMEQMVSNDYHQVVGNWRGLWQLNISPKFKNFIWRVVRVVLPNRIPCDFVV